MIVHEYEIVKPDAKQVLHRYKSFAHLRAHISQASDRKITMCMNRHLLRGGTISELLELARRDNQRLASHEFLDAQRLRVHFKYMLDHHGWMIESNKHGVYRIVGNCGERDERIDREFDDQTSYHQNTGSVINTSRVTPITPIKPPAEANPEMIRPADDTTASCLQLPPLDEPRIDELEPLPCYPDFCAPEGRKYYELHRLHERNRKLVIEKKKQAFLQDPLMLCEVCNFSFIKNYGEWGKRFAEVHHKMPLSALSIVTETRLADLAIVCSNCHSMLHRQGHRTLTIDELKRIIEQAKPLTSPAAT